MSTVDAGLPPSFATARDLLDYLLEDGKLLPDQLDDVVARIPEGQYLDYKDGKLTQKGRVDEGRRTIREWVSGFANAEGGVLVVGVAEALPGAKRPISPCHRVGQEPLDDWGEKLLRDMTGYLSPPPRFQVVPHPLGEILVIAVDRAPQLVPCIESRELKYFLRIHTSTLEVPSFLISDLVLGRRKHPAIGVTLQRAIWGEGRYRPPTFAPTLALKLELRIENHALFRVERLAFGVVGWSLGTAQPPPFNQHLQAHVDAGETPGWSNGPARWRLVHEPREVEVLPPFHQQERKDAGQLIVPHHVDGTFGCGLYVLPEGAPPTWFQLELRTDGRPTTVNAGEFEAFDVKFTRLSTARPRLFYTRSTTTTAAP